MPKAAVRDVEIAYDELGEGLPLLFIHGFPLSRRMWTPQLQDLSSDYRVLALDLRGFGGSSKPKSSYSVEVFAEDVASFIEEVVRSSVVLIGHSMGGYIAFQLLRRNPSLVLSMVLVNTKAETDPDEKALITEMSNIIRRNGKEKFFRWLAQRLLAPEKSSKPKLLEQVVELMENADEETLTSVLKALAERPNYAGLLKKVRTPTLIIAGDHDQLIPVESALNMARKIPGSAVALIKGAGHLPNIEKPEEFNNVIRRFLGSLEKR